MDSAFNNLKTDFSLLLIKNLLKKRKEENLLNTPKEEQIIRWRQHFEGLLIRAVEEPIENFQNKFEDYKENGRIDSSTPTKQKIAEAIRKLTKA